MGAIALAIPLTFFTKERDAWGEASAVNTAQKFQSSGVSRWPPSHAT
jgi:hypothetical protein